MSFTNKDGSLKSKVYESLTRLARREKNFWLPQDRMTAYWEGYRDAVYDTLKKLSKLEEEKEKAWRESVEGIYDAWEAGAFEPLESDLFDIKWDASLLKYEGVREVS